MSNLTWFVILAGVILTVPAAVAAAATWNWWRR